MTMLNTNTRNVLTSAGGTTFAYTFKILSNSDILVMVANSDGQSAVTKLLDTDYTVTGAGNPNGGNVIFTSAVTAGKLVVLVLRPSLTQTLDLVVADSLPAESLEAAMDRLTSQVNSLQEKINRCLILPDATPATTQPVIPDYKVTANQSKYLRLGTSGIEAGDPTSGGAVSLTTKGDLLTHNGTSEVRLPTGADYSLLMALGSEASGVKWEDIHNVPGVTGVIGAITNETSIVQNGNMNIWQRGTSVVSPVTTQMLADKWRLGKSGTTGNITVSRSTTVPTLLAAEPFQRFSMQVACTTADASMDSTDYLAITQHINPKTFTPWAQRAWYLSFWVRSSVTGTYNVALNNTALDRACVIPYTISAADTWEWKALAIPATPSAGTWNYTESASATALYLSFVLMAGSGLGTVTASTWTTMAATPGVRTSSGQANFLSSTSNNFFITGIQADAGIAPVALRRTTFSADLDICKRSFQMSFPYGTLPATNAGTTGAVNYKCPAAGALASGVWISFAPAMDYITSGAIYNPSAANQQFRNSTLAADFTSSTFGSMAPHGAMASATGTAATAVGNNIQFHWTITGETNFVSIP